MRRECIVAGHSTYEINAFLTTERSSDKNNKMHFEPRTKAPNHQDILESRRHTLESSLLDGWTDTRDRINRWMLHTLRTDEAQARLHRSMLVEPDIGEEAWARLVLKYWNLDEAATGIELRTSFVDRSSRQSGCLGNGIGRVSQLCGTVGGD